MSNDPSSRQFTSRVALRPLAGFSLQGYSGRSILCLRAVGRRGAASGPPEPPPCLRGGSGFDRAANFIVINQRSQQHWRVRPFFVTFALSCHSYWGVLCRCLR